MGFTITSVYLWRGLLFYMGKQPYIPLYIGDWEQDLNCVSLEAEGAALKLIFKLWKSKTRGLLLISFSQMVILFKKSDVETRKIFEELRQNDIFSVKNIDENTVEIISRRMVRDAQLSKVRSEIGKQGGRPKKPKQKQTETKTKAKVKQNPEYEYEYDNEIDNEIKGGVGEISIYPTFEQFWEAYDKNVDRANAEFKWVQLSQKEKEKVMLHVPEYVASTPDKNFRLNATNYLQNKSWENEIIKPIESNGISSKQQAEFTRNYHAFKKGY